MDFDAGHTGFLDFWSLPLVQKMKFIFSCSDMLRRRIENTNVGDFDRKIYRIHFYMMKGKQTLAFTLKGN